MRPAFATTFARMLCIAVALTLVAGEGSHLLVTPAQAQATGERQGGGLLRFLFGRSNKQDRQAPQARQPKPRRTTAVRRTPRPAEPVVAAVEKSEDARKVLVVGDFLAGGLADGLVAAYAENADILVIDRANGSSGLVRDDHYDWPGRIVDVIEEAEPDAVVVMIGSNDRQQMRTENGREQPRSEGWTAEYERRVSSLAKGVRDKGLPLIWVGNLPFRSSSMTSDMIAFNDIYRRIVTDLGGEFVDVWDGFVNEAGTFVSSGPDMNGQPAQLRSSDGINVTRQGRRKIAFYVEKPLARLFNGGQASGVARIGPGATDLQLQGADPREIERTVPVSLDELGAGNGGALLGALVTPRGGDTATAAERLVREGLAPAPRAGRADDFGGRRQSVPATPTAIATPAEDAAGQ